MKSIFIVLFTALYCFGNITISKTINRPTDTVKIYKAVLDSIHARVTKERIGRIDTAYGDTSYFRVNKSRIGRIDTVYSDTSYSRVRKSRIGRIDTVYGDSLNERTIKSTVFRGDSLRIGSVSNNTIIDTGYGIFLNGNTTVYNDIEQFYLFAAKNIGQTGAPPLTASGKGFSFPAFNINDSLEGQVEYNHQYIDPGDTLHFHLHYETNGKDNTARYVKWSVHYKIMNINDTLTYENTITYQDTIPANTPTLQHRFIEIGEVAVPVLSIGAYIFIMLKRIAASPATNPTNNPYGITLGIHAKINTLGSRTETTK